jgi:signal transduction histidine kinase
MIGLEASATERLFEEATVAAQANPAGIPIFDGDGGPSQEAERRVVEGDLSLEIPLSMGSSVAGDAVEVVSAFGSTGVHQILRQALADAVTQEEALSRIRRLIWLLTGLRHHFFFLPGSDGKRLAGIATGDDPDSLAKLAVSLESSRSLLARAAVDFLPARATGPALDDGVAIDRVLARMLEAVGLLCLPMVHEASTLGVIAIGLPSDWEEPAEEEALLAWLASLAAETLSRISQRSGNEERTRAELTDRFRSAGKRIVHEVGNPLTIVKNYLKLLGDKLGEKGQFHEELTILNEELDRVTRIVQRMGDPLAIELEEPVRLDLNSVVHELMTLCRDTLFGKRGIEVVQQLDPQLPLLHADVGAIKQVALNVLTNAAEAMPNGGRLGVMTADSVNFGGELFVLLQVSDSGGGVPPEVMQRLFQPGTSTKGAGHEGIGLTESASILKRLGGQIICRSSVGRGTIFLILLPRRMYSAAAENDRPADA